MTDNKNLQLTQLKNIHLLLSLLTKNPFQSKENILKYFEANDKSINERTFYRLKKKLTLDFGIEIEFDYGQGGYFLNEEISTNPKSFLSLLEILIISEMFASNFGEKNNALFFVEFENEAHDKTVPNFKSILEAIQKNLEITFTHFSFYHIKEEKYTLKPYFLKQYQNRWYVVGETEKGYRTFGIDRIENINITTKKFKPKTEDAKDQFSNVIGLNYVDHKLEKIHLSFHITQKPYLESLPLHRSQKQIHPENQSSFDIELLIHPNFEFRQQILKYGSLVKVIEPKWLASEIKEELRKGFEGY